jgi:hypothetical protein
LRHITDAHAAAGRAGAPIGLFETGQNAQERRLARAIWADQTDLIVLQQPERKVLEQRSSTVGFGYRFAEKEWKGHA